MSANAGSYFVARTVEALEVLSFGPLSAPRVAAALQIHPRTARRMLNRLEEEGYVTQRAEPRRRYELTLHVVALAGQALERAPLGQAAAPLIGRLYERTGLSAHLVVPSYDSVLCVAHRDRTPCPALPRPRELVPCHCTAGGKVLLAGRDRWRQSVLRRPLTAYTERTKTDPRWIAAELSTVREVGYATEDGEYQPDMSAIAAPVRTIAGTVIAAVTVCSTEHLDIDATAAEVVRTADTITIVGRHLGLDQTHVAVMTHVAEAGELTPSELARRVGLTSGSIRTITRRLEREGHLLRRPHPVDRRCVLLRLAPLTEIELQQVRSRR